MAFSAVAFNLLNSDFSVKLSLASYHLELGTPFGTSQSQSSSRTNALLTIRLESKGFAMEGAGEVGLPPKKRGCYEANFHDIFAYFGAFASHAARKAATLEASAYDPFAAVPVKFFKPLRAAIAEHAR